MTENLIEIFFGRKSPYVNQNHQSILSKFEIHAQFDDNFISNPRNVHKIWILSPWTIKSGFV